MGPIMDVCLVTCQCGSGRNTILRGTAYGALQQLMGRDFWSWLWEFWVEEK